MTEQPPRPYPAIAAKRDFKITVLEGDGIGPEVIAEGLKVLALLQERGVATFQIHREIFRRRGDRCHRHRAT